MTLVDKKLEPMAVVFFAVTCFLASFVAVFPILMV